MAEAEDLKSSKCGFDPHRGHVDVKTEITLREPTICRRASREADPLRCRHARLDTKPGLLKMMAPSSTKVSSKWPSSVITVASFRASFSGVRRRSRAAIPESMTWIFGCTLVRAIRVLPQAGNR